MLGTRIERRRETDVGGPWDVKRGSPSETRRSVGYREGQIVECEHGGGMRMRWKIPQSSITGRECPGSPGTPGTSLSSVV